MKKTRTEWTRSEWKEENEWGKSCIFRHKSFIAKQYNNVIPCTQIHCSRSMFSAVCHSFSSTSPATSEKNRFFLVLLPISLGVFILFFSYSFSRLTVTLSWILFLTTIWREEEKMWKALEDLNTRIDRVNAKNKEQKNLSITEENSRENCFALHIVIRSLASDKCVCMLAARCVYVGYCVFTTSYKLRNFSFSFSMLSSLVTWRVTFIKYTLDLALLLFSRFCSHFANLFVFCLIFGTKIYFSF